MKSFVIILKENEHSVSYGTRAIETGKSFGWKIEPFYGIDGRSTSLENFSIVATKKAKKCNQAFNRPGVVGCFLSHYLLWKKCIEINEPIGIFEHDSVFLKPNTNTIEYTDVLRLDKPEKIGKNYGTGIWWEGAHAYFLKPAGAQKLINWTIKNGAYPADVALGTDVVDIQFNLENLIFLNRESKKHSLTVPETF